MYRVVQNKRGHRRLR